MTLVPDSPVLIEMSSEGTAIVATAFAAHFQLAGGSCVRIPERLLRLGLKEVKAEKARRLRRVTALGVNPE